MGVRIAILQGSATGTTIYQELFNPNPQTNANGLVSLEIGTGLPITGTFSGINWAAGPYFLKTETDPAGGTNYTVVGTSELLSVPYALYSRLAQEPANNSVNSLKILDGSIVTADLANGTVTSSKIADGNVSTSDLADNSVTSARISSTGADANEVLQYTADNAGGETVCITGVFTGFGAGTHTISIWVHAQGTGTGTYASLNPENSSSDHFIIKEVVN